MSITVRVLGCGSSVGVPEIGCECAVCTSPDPRNKRTRVSVTVETQGKRLLIDTSPDFKQQMLQQNIKHIDAVLFTHDHADHVHGIDDIRSYNYLQNQPIDCFADAHTQAILSTRFPYIFLPPPKEIWYRPALTPHVIEPYRPFVAAGVEVLPFTQLHGQGESLGLRIGNFAYSTDVNGFPPESEPYLQGLDVWVVDCLRYTPSRTHSRLELTLQWIEKYKPRLAVLTHMAHQFDYATLAAELPQGVVPGYDGLLLHSS